MRKEYSNDLLGEIHDYGIDLNRRHIYIHGHTSHVDEDQGVEFRMAIRVAKNILFLDQVNNPIVCHLQTIGGEWDSGMTIYDVIKNAKSYISVLCHGEVMSMGTIILQAADIRYAMPSCSFMFHYGSSDICGEYLAAHSQAEIEKKQNKFMLDLYTEKCLASPYAKEYSKTKNQIRRFIKSKLDSKGDWFLDSEEAQYYGFVDKVIGKDCELKDL